MGQTEMTVVVRSATCHDRRAHRLIAVPQFRRDLFERHALFVQRRSLPKPELFETAAAHCELTPRLPPPRLFGPQWRA